MTVRPIDMALEKIKSKIREMSGLTENIVNEMSKGVYRLEDIADIANRVKNLRKEIHSLVVETIARYQPVASDLRYLIAILEISYGLFRFSRYALDIAYMVRGLSRDLGSECDFEVTRRMLPLVVKMMRDSVESFMYRETSIAGEVIGYDSQIDLLLKEAVKRAVERGDRCSYMDLIVAIYLERIADHSVNIASETLFLS